MSTDRRLLEMAAKAAGYSVIWNEQWHCFQHRNPTPDAHGRMRHPWTPDADDGDALCLAIKLDILIDPCSKFCRCDAVGHGVSIREEYGLDPMAAVRRAITRAAAAIGEKMP